jgi:GNAT superfamily N-acetyltransferase
MKNLTYRVATEKDIAFIGEVYHENIESLHGNCRNADTWKKLLSEPDKDYYIVGGKTPVAWFRTDVEEGGFWLGMVQVLPEYHRQGVGTFILAAAEAMAKEKGYSKIGVHTTQDNTAARALYQRAGYAQTEIGPCFTADGVERIGYTFEKELK